MFRLELNAADLAEMTFAVSPLHETLTAVAQLHGVHRDPAMQPWITRLRPRYERLRSQVPLLDVVATLRDTREYFPRFLCPTAERPEPGIDAQLATVRATPVPRVRREIDRYVTERGGPPPPAVWAVREAPDAAARLADALRTAWDELIRPDWPTIHGILRQDLQRRSAQLIATGWNTAMNGLSARLRWRVGDEITAIESPYRPQEYHPPGGGGPILGPTVFGVAQVMIDSGLRREVRYLAGGGAAAAEPETTPGPPGEALAHLIGRTRADLLNALERPATTTGLSNRHRLSLGATGHHLAALRNAGLVARTREGGSVIYHRTPLGDVLVDGNLT